LIKRIYFIINFFKIDFAISASILRDNSDEAVNSLDFAKRAKMIKKRVTKNVILCSAELEFLSTALKEEILILRGQLVNAGLTYNYIKNKKVLNFIRNEQYVIDGKEQESEKNKNMLEIEDSSRSNSTGTSSIGDIKHRKRMSIMNLDEEQLILKYCELRAKYENLEEATRNKIIHDHSQETFAREMIDEVKTEASKKINQIDSKRLQELNDLREKLEKEKEGYIKSQIDLEKKMVLLEGEKIKLEDELLMVKRDIEGIQEFANLVENDNNTTQEKLEKKSIFTIISTIIF
jgi:hypothetical protein